MVPRNLPQPFEIDKIRFAHCFTAPSLRHFAVLITGWVLTIGTHTISQVVLTTGLHESEHFSGAYRFFLKAKWDVDMVACRVFRMIVGTFLSDQAAYEVVIDDTLHSHVGRKICGAGVQHDGDAPKTGKPIGYGVCFVTIGLAVRLPGISVRIFCLPYAARLWWPKKTKSRPRWARYKTKTQLAAELVKLTRSWMHPSVTLRVIVDGGYSNGTLIRNRPHGVEITGKVRTDGALYAPVIPQQVAKRGRPRKKGQRLPTPKSMHEDADLDWEWIWIRLYGKETIVAVHRFEAIWYKAAGNELLSIVLVRDPTGEYPDMAFFDTDINAPDEATIQRFSHRWSTEITYRETKSLLGSADPQCRKESSVKKAPMMAYWSYCFVVIWFVEQLRLGKDFLIQRPPWYLRKTDITFSDMLAAARRSQLAPVISREPRQQARESKIPTPHSHCEVGQRKFAKL
jgi:SRSO17 transposase